MKLILKHLQVFFHGKGRCGDDQVSFVLYKSQVDEDDFDSTTHMLIADVCLYYVLSYILLKIKANWDSIELKLKISKDFFVRHIFSKSS